MQRSKVTHRKVSRRFETSARSSASMHIPTSPQYTCELMVFNQISGVAEGAARNNRHRMIFLGVVGARILLPVRMIKGPSRMIIKDKS